MTKYSFAGLILLSFLMTSCSGKHEEAISNSASSLPSHWLVQKIDVSIDESKLNADRVATAKKYELVTRLTSGIQKLLQEQSHYDNNEGNITLHISLNNFRLRSGSSAFWLGPMAGADKVSVHVSVKQNGIELQAFDTNTSTALGGMVLPAPSQRINRMAKELSKRIVDNL